MIGGGALVAAAPLLGAAQQAATPGGAAPVSGGPAWVVATNLVIWAGLFLYLLRLERRLGAHRPAGAKEDP
jgi:CcmD family protein